MEIVEERWQSANDSVSLNKSDLHIWRADLPQDEARSEIYWRVLNEEERQRASRFKFAKHRNRFIIARGILRFLLADYLSLLPQEVNFQYSAHGKPEIAPEQNPDSLRFNLSHSHDMATYVFAYRYDVGIDVEYLLHDCEANEIAKRFFSEKEYEEYCLVPDEFKQIAFFNAWTRKEAFIKAVGQGLSYRLSKFAVTLTPGQPARLLNIESDPNAAAGWSLHAFEPNENYVAAIAVNRPNYSPHYLQWRHFA